jgi:hypothetical protein
MRPLLLDIAVLPVQLPLQQMAGHFNDATAAVPALATHMINIWCRGLVSMPL